MENPYKSPSVDAAFLPNHPSMLRRVIGTGLLLLSPVLASPVAYFAFVIFPGDWSNRHSNLQIAVVWIATMSFGVAGVASAFLGLAVLEKTWHAALIGIGLFLFAIVGYFAMYWLSSWL